MSEDLKKKLEECEKKSQEYLAGWQRSRADFLNYKKEEAARMEELVKFANTELILRLLPILDNFDIAEKSLIGKDSPELKGFLQIKAQLLDFLKSQGVEKIKSVGEKFDPALHEAVGEESGQESGKIIEEIQKGYKLYGRVIRPAKVKIIK